MKKLSQLLLCLTVLCLLGCSDSDTSTDVPPPPAPSEDDLGDPSGSPEDMFPEDPPAGESSTEDSTEEAPEGTSATE